MKSWMKVGAAFAVLCSALFAAGCDNKAKMTPGSTMLVTDNDGNQYVVEHKMLETYRVTRLPK